MCLFGKVYAKNQDTTPKLREGLNPLSKDGQRLSERVEYNLSRLNR
jgi:hypothetical protein